MSSIDQAADERSTTHATFVIERTYEAAPQRVFDVSTGFFAQVSSLSGTYSVKADGDALPLGALPLPRARTAIAAARKSVALSIFGSIVRGM